MFPFNEIIPVLLNDNHSKANHLVFIYNLKWKEISDKEAALSSSATHHTGMETCPMPHSSQWRQSGEGPEARKDGAFCM